MNTAFLIVRRNVALKDVPLEHTIIGTTEVIGIAVTEAERDTALQQNKGAHALEMTRVGVSLRADTLPGEGISEIVKMHLGMGLGYPQDVGAALEGLDRIDNAV